MCDPITMSTLAIASGVTQFAGQQQAANQQQTFQNQLTGANSLQASLQQSAERLQLAQRKEGLSREAEKARIASREAQATAKVAAGEAGVTGNSVTALLSSFSAEQGRFIEAVTRESQFADIGSDTAQAQISKATAFQNLRINAPVSRPSILATGLKIGVGIGGIISDSKAT